MANFDAINLVISAEDKFSPEFDKAGAATEKVLQKTQDLLNIEEEYLNRNAEFFVDAHQRRVQQEKDMQQMKGASLAAAEKELEKRIAAEEKYSTNQKNHEQLYVDLLGKRDDLEQKKFETVKEYYDFWEKGNSSVQAGIDATNRKISNSTGLWNRLGTAAGAAGSKIQSGAQGATKNIKQFGAANASALDELNRSSPQAIQALQSIGGTEFSQTIAGLVGISEQLVKMNQIQKQGGKTETAAKLGLITGALVLLKPVIGAAISYFKDTASAAEAVGVALERTKDITKGYIKRNDELTSNTMKWIDLAQTAAEKEKLWAGETERLDVERERLRTGIIREQKEVTALSGIWGKYFQAEEKQMAEARLAGLKQEREALKNNTDELNKGRSVQERKLAAAEKTAERAKHFSRMDIDARLKLQNLQHADDRRAIARQEVFTRVARSKFKWHRHEIDLALERVKQQQDEMDMQERAKAKIKADEKAAEEAAKKKEDAEKKAAQDQKTREDMLMGLRHKRFLGMKDEIGVRQEQLKLTGLYTDAEIKLISTQEQKMRDTKEMLGKEPETYDISNAEVGRLMSGQTTEKMTEADQKKIRVSEEIKQLNSDQLDALKNLFVTEMANPFGSGGGGR